VLLNPYLALVVILLEHEEDFHEDLGFSLANDDYLLMLLTQKS